jgi:hypothetical protein
MVTECDLLPFGQNVNNTQWIMPSLVLAPSRGQMQVLRSHVSTVRLNLLTREAVAGLCKDDCMHEMQGTGQARCSDLILCILGKPLYLLAICRWSSPEFGQTLKRDSMFDPTFWYFQ